MGGDVVGRAAELRAAGALLDRLGEGPLAIVIEGEAGIGKTTVWRAVVAMAAERGLTVLQSRPTESEARLAFSALADLLQDVPGDVLDVLPAPQRRALDIALLRAEPDGAGIDARAATAGTAGALRALAKAAPVVVALDDLQWLDRASVDALAFVVRRLGGSPIGFLVARRPADEATGLDLEAALPADRFARLPLGPLGATVLYHLFNERLGRALPRSTIVRIAELSGGNPFHALEVARAVADQGGPRAGAPLPVPASVRGLAGDRIRRLPDGARRALLRAAALARPTSATVDVAHLAPAETAGLVEVDLDGHVRFTHPLFAAAVYGDASPAERRAVHRELVAVVPDVEERALHAALAATGPDPAVAALLDGAAARARARGATAAAADLVELALRLTPTDATGDRLRREIELADHLHLAGQPGRAIAVLEGALERATEGDARAEVLIAIGMIAGEIDHVRAIGSCEEALGHARGDALRARAHATLAFLYETRDVATAARHSAAAAELFASLGDTVSWGLATEGHCWHELMLGHGSDPATFERALATTSDRPGAGAWWVGLPPVWMLAHDDFGGARSLFAANLDRARQEGSEGEVGLLQAVIAQIDCWLGRPEAADAAAAEAVELARLGGSHTSLADALRVRANIDAIRGRVDRARDTLLRELPELGIAGAGRLSFGTGIVLGFVAHSLDDHATADDLFSRTTAALAQAGIVEMPGYMYLGDHVESVLALGDVERAGAITTGLEARTRVFPRPWTLAVAARCRGLVLASGGDLDGAATAMATALVHHEQLANPYELGRTLIAKAHVHRRRTEKRMARDELQRAVALLEAAGAELWAGRARRELERLRFRTAPSELTETERRIAELAAAGRTNREIASLVFVSPKTVEARLASVYGKLGIRSRAELGARMAAGAPGVTGEPAGAVEPIS